MGDIRPFLLRSSPVISAQQCIDRHAVVTALALPPGDTGTCSYRWCEAMQHSSGQFRGIVWELGVDTLFQPPSGWRSEDELRIKATLFHVDEKTAAV